MKLKHRTFNAYRCVIDYTGIDGLLYSHVEPICAIDKSDASNQVDDLVTHFSKGAILHISLEDFSRKFK